MAKRKVEKQRPKAETFPTMLYVGLGEKDWDGESNLFADAGLELFRDGQAVGVYQLVEVSKKQTAHNLV